MITCTRRLEFDFAHRVLNHESKCKHWHGHRGVVEIEAHAEGLDSIGRIIDFSVLKQKIGTWIDDNWDHNSIIFDEDLDSIAAFELIKGNKKPFVAPWNPTAENIANHLLTVVCPELLKDSGVTVVKVRFWETPNGSAEATC